ncbi:hypothetical protein NliqN6_4087 [Naganishia liquefaciens]|uniref:Uncharacterized protein n=1 Tax=Naganishia liquefaciens TaxID=104408 RepID=A0A8H3YFF6_9TREE|nr:hypothetical protein NliqN6_4087 [Naganishia liquefaciens]
MAAPSTNPATPASDPPKPQTTRHVPGAGDLLSKRPKKKKPVGDSSKASGTKTTEDTPVALLTKAPDAADLPAELRGEQGDIERELKEDAAAVAAAGGHEKGAVGEAVSRRIKVLTKKITLTLPFRVSQQRFRAYTEKPESALNPDQKAAIATLPTLEGGLRELEDIAKAVETIEHEHRLASRDELEAAKLEAVEVYKRETLPLLSSLIAVHSSLHPASVSTSTSFIPVDLPPHLQDISSSDVSAVDDMYERLRNGGSEGVEVVLSLVKGLEGSHLHAVLTGQTTSAQIENATPNFSPAGHDDTVPLPSEEAPASLTFIQQTTTSEGYDQPMSAGNAMAAFEQGPESADMPPKEVPSSRTEGMSFMQTSELAKESQQHAAENTLVHAGQAQSGPGVSMTQAPGSTDEPQNAAPPSVAQLDAQAVSRSSSYPGFDVSETLASKLSGQQLGSWADVEDSHHVLETFAMPTTIDAPSASAPAPATTEEAVPTDLAPTLAAAATDNAQAKQSTREGGRGRGGRGGPRGNHRGGPRGGFRRNGAPNGQSANGLQAQQNKDDDGFEIAGRRRQGHAQGQNGVYRGRGRGRGAGSTEGQRGGRGSFRGRGARRSKELESIRFADDLPPIARQNGAVQQSTTAA